MNDQDLIKKNGSVISQNYYSRDIKLELNEDSESKGN